MSETITLRSLLIGGLLVSLGTILTSYANLSIPVFMVILSVLVISYIPKTISFIACEKCKGRGKIPCGEFCKEGHLSPVLMSTSHTMLGLVDKKEAGVFYHMGNVSYSNNGGRGKAILKVKAISSLDKKLLGEYISDEVPIEARVGGTFELIEIKLNHFPELKKTLDREPRNDDMYTDASWEITDKGQICSSCNGKARKICTECNGKRLKFL